MFGPDAVEVETKEVLAPDASGEGSSLTALLFLRKTFKMCADRSLVVVDRPRPMVAVGSWKAGAKACSLEVRCEECSRKVIPIPQR